MGRDWRYKNIHFPMLSARAAVGRRAGFKALAAPKRAFGGYTGQYVADEDLVRKNDDWVIEETNFCLGRTANIRFRETDDMARRVKRILEHQTCYMHTRLRDGTVIPFSSYGIMGVMERPIAAETHLEQAVIKWCWISVTMRLLM